jgi:hypothetical protein
VIRYARLLTGDGAVEVEGNEGRFVVPAGAIEAWVENRRR